MKRGLQTQHITAELGERTSRLLFGILGDRITFASSGSWESRNSTPALQPDLRQAPGSWASILQICRHPLKTFNTLSGHECQLCCGIKEQPNKKVQPKPPHIAYKVQAAPPVL